MVEASESGFRGPKQINHVALSVSPELLGQRGEPTWPPFSKMYSEGPSWT